MAKKGLCEIVLVVDRSGSMDDVKSDAIGAFNAFLEEQKRVPGEASVTLAMFNHEYEIRKQGVALANIEPFDDESYHPAGMTALLDAVARTIDSLDERHANTPEDQKPEKIIFAILTDGRENSSKEYNYKQVMDKIDQHRSVHKWEFLFLGVGQESFDEGAKWDSIPISSHAYSLHTSEGVRQIADILSRKTTHFRKDQKDDHDET